MRRSFSGFYLVIIGIAFMSLLVATNEGATAGKGGSAEEAKAMLERAVVAIKADKTAALKAFTVGTEGFKDRDLYVFCGDPDGMVSAHGASPALVGTDLRKIIDRTGKKLGEAIYAVAMMGKISTVAYMWPRPGESKAVAKSSYVTKVGDQVCGVGHYK